MTIEECKKYLPNGWADMIEQDPVLSEDRKSTRLNSSHRL